MSNFVMPWVRGDFKSKTARLSRVQKHAYRDLLEACFAAGGTLPDDDGKLARICEIDIRTWRKHRSAVLAYFYLTPEGWRQTRIDDDLERIRKKREQTRQAGSKGGLQTHIRWHRRKR